MKITVLAAAIALVLVAAARGDWSTCASDLTRLQRAARDAADHAESLDSKGSDAKVAKDRYESCRQDPSGDDAYSDHCETLRSRAESVRRDYRDAVSELQNELDDVRRYGKRADSSCTDESNDVKANAALFCESMRKMKGKLSDADLMGACTIRFPDAFCKACLGMR